MANETIYTKTPVKVVNRNGFDKSFNTLTTIDTGTLVPVLVDEILPNTTISLGSLANCELFPFAAPFDGKIDFRMETFFVPSRTLWDGADTFFAQQNQYDPDKTRGIVPANVPLYSPSQSRISLINNPEKHTLENYMGDNRQTFVGTGDESNALPYLAYAKIYSDYYRDDRIQRSPFCPTDISGSTVLSSMPYRVQTATFTDSDHYADGSMICELRQRNYDRDYFTTAMLRKALDDTLMVTTNEDGEFSIEQLREINALTRFNEVLAQIGNGWSNVCRSIYGCNPVGVPNRAVYLGQMRSRVYNNTIMDNSSVSQLSGDDGVTYGVDRSNSGNPYFAYNTGTGASSMPASTMDSSLVNNFTAREHGYLFVLASVVPIAQYAAGRNRLFAHKQYADFGNGMLAGIGNQPIFNYELSRYGNFKAPQIFGWTDRYSEYKYRNDYVSGRYDGGDFTKFSLRRTGFGAGVKLNSEFITIPKTALDTVAMFPSSNNTFVCHRLNIGFKYHIVQPLPSYSIPTLGDIQDSHTEMVDKGGKHL